MNNKKYKIVTLGCKVNAYESYAVASLLKKEGYTQTNDNDYEVCIINTCSVTSTSDKKSRQKIRHLIKENPNAIMIVMGCFSQLNFDKVSLIEGVDIVLGTTNRQNIITYINEFKKTKKQVIRIKNLNKYIPYENISIINFAENVRAYVKIQDGCNNFCSYCIIPYTRGRQRSRNKEDIICEISALVKNGYKEVVLTGIHTGSYGSDLDNYSFTDLLKDILDNVKDLERLRISSIEINEINDEIIDLISKNKVIVNHLHIPLQSGSDNVLKKMNRRYSKDYFIKRIKYIKSKIKDISITTDVIVGFPSETDEDFLESLDSIKKIGFSKIHVFPFSSRSGTPASKMKNVFDDITKKKRVDTLLDLSKKLEYSYASKFLNSTQKVLFEKDDEESGYLKGHTSNYLLVKAKAPISMVGKIALVKIKDIENIKEIKLVGEIDKD